LKPEIAKQITLLLQSIEIKGTSVALLSKLLKRNTKMKIYKTIIRPVVTYSSEIWTLTAKDENNLRIFERQVLRKIFGPVNMVNTWRIRNNMEIDKLMRCRYSEIH